tara:strand:- start:323 stop:484 length:162 start_codon:yes stop_codon:yes gene_type:complete
LEFYSAPIQVDFVSRKLIRVDKLFVFGCTKLIAFFEYRLRIVDIRQQRYGYTV